MTWLLLLACGPGADAISTGIGSDNPAVREDMVAAGKLVDDPAVVQALIGALDDPSADIRVAALESLAELDAVDAVPSILPRLQDTEPKVQRAAVETLARLGDPQAVPDLVEYVDGRRHGRVPLNAIWALGVLGDAQALPLLATLREHEDPYVVYNACNALREIGDVRSDEELPEAPVPAQVEEPQTLEERLEELDGEAPEEAPAPAAEEDKPPAIQATFPGQ